MLFLLKMTIRLSSIPHGQRLLPCLPLFFEEVVVLKDCQHLEMYVLKGLFCGRVVYVKAFAEMEIVFLGIRLF